MKKNIYIIIMKKKKFWYRTWATAQVSLRLGWALGAGRAGAGQAQGARGACVGSAGASWAGALGARRQARQACVGAGRGAQVDVRGHAGRRRQEAAARELSGRAAGRAAGVGARGRRQRARGWADGR